MSEADSPAKRRLLSGLGAGGGVLGISALVPATWVKPVVDAVVLPTHAQGTQIRTGTREVEVPRGTPTGLTVTYNPQGAEGPEVNVAWTAPTAPGVVAYVIRYNRTGLFTAGGDAGGAVLADWLISRAVAQGGDNGEGVVRVEHTGPGPYSETIPLSAPLAATEQFHVLLQAIYNAENSDGSTTSSASPNATTQSVGGEEGDEVRGAPTNVTATLSGTSGVRVTWNAAPAGVDRYTLRYRKGNAAYRTGSGDTATVAADAARTHTFTFPGNEADLLPGDTFTVEVTAVYEQNETQAATTHPATDVTPAFGQEQRGAPTNVSATLSGTSGVSVTWDAAPAGVDRYTLRYRKGTAAYRTDVGTTATVAADATLEHVFTLPENEVALLPGDTFTVEVSAVYDQSGTQARSERAATATTSAVAEEARGAPTNVAATLSGTNGVSVTWSAAPAGVERYSLRYRRGAAAYRTGAGNTVTVAADATLEHVFTLPGNEAALLPGDTFTVEVTAVYEQSGTQARSEHAATDATPAVADEQRGAPVNVTAASPNSDGVYVSWDAAPAGVDRYSLRYRRSGETGFRTGAGTTATVAANATLEHTFIFSENEGSFQPGDTFTVEVRAVYDASGTQARSEHAATDATPAIPGPVGGQVDEQRGAPTGVTATLSGTSGVSVTWGAAPAGVDRYSLRYRRGTAAYRTGADDTATIAANAGRTYTFALPGNEAALQAGDTFTVEVTAVYDANGTQAASTHAAADATPAFVDEEADEQRGAPTSVTAILSGTSGVRVTWGAAPTGVDEYSLRYQRSGETGFRTGDANTATVQAGATLEHTFTLPGNEADRLPGDTFTVEVTAVYEQSGTQAASEHEATATTPAVAEEARGAPTNVSATLSGTSGVRVTWSAAPAGVDEYSLRYQRSGETGFRTGDANTATVEVGATLEHTFTLPGNEADLLPGDTFTVEVMAVYEQVGTQVATEHEATATTSALGQEQRGAPTNVSATLSGTTGVRVTWDAAPIGVDEYSLRYRRSSDSGSGYRTGVGTTETIAADATLEHTFTLPSDEGLLPGDTFTVEVTAVYEQSGTQARSERAATATTSAVAEEARGAPANVSATLSGTSGVRVTWDAAPIGVDEYSLRYRRSSDSGSGYRTDAGTTATVAAGATLEHTFTLPVGEAERLPGDTFTVEVTAVYEQAGTQISTEHEATAVTPAVAEEARGAPVNVSATLSGTSGVRVTWGAAPAGVDEYTLRYRKGTDAYRTDADTTATVAADAALEHVFAFPTGEVALLPGDTFTVEVTAVYEQSGTQTATEHEATAVTPAFGQEQRGAPTNVSATLSGTSGVRVTWDAAPTGVDEYTLRYQKGSDGYRTGSGNIATVQAGATLEHTFTFPGNEADLLPGDTFTVEVSAVYEQSGTQARSERAATATTTAVADEQRGAPAGVTATLSGTSGVNVTWDAAPAGVDEYTLRYQKGSDGYRTGSGNIATVQAGATLEHTFTLPENEADLLPGDTFTVEVTAVYDASGTQAASEHEATDVTPAVADEQRGAPAGVTATLSGTSGVSVTWDAAPVGVDEYTLRYRRSSDSGSGYRTGAGTTETVSADATLEHTFTLPVGEAALLPGDTFTVEVTAVYDASGTQAATEHEATDVTPAVADEQRGAPTGVTATLSGTTGVSVTWGAAPVGVDRYTLRYQKGSDGYRTGSANTATVSADATLYTFDFPVGEAALQAGDTFTVEVTAEYDTSGTQAATDHEATGDTPAFVPEVPEVPEDPGPPTNVTATLSDDSTEVSVTWGAAPAGVDRYTLRYGKNPGLGFRYRGDTATVAVGGPLEHTFILPDNEPPLRLRDIFRVEVTAEYDADGTQDASTHQAIGTTPAFVPEGEELRGPPRNVDATFSGSTGVEVTWEAAPGGVDRYTLGYRKQSDDEPEFRTAPGTTATVEADDPLTHTFTFPSDEDLQEGDVYAVGVTAVYDATDTQPASVDEDLFFASSITLDFREEGPGGPGPGVPPGGGVPFSR